MVKCVGNWTRDADEVKCRQYRIYYSESVLMVVVINMNYLFFYFTLFFPLSYHFTCPYSYFISFSFSITFPPLFAFTFTFTFTFTRHLLLACKLCNAAKIK